MDISDDSELELLVTSEPKRRRRTRRVPTVDLVKPAKKRRAKGGLRVPKRRKAAPRAVKRAAVIELDDEDQVIETCSAYEEAFFGAKSRDDVKIISTTAPTPPMAAATAPAAMTPSSAVAPEPATPPARRSGPSLSLLALSLRAWRQSQAAVPSLSCVTLPKDLPLPAAPASPKAESASSQLGQDLEPEVIEFDEEPQELMPQVPYSQAYVERLRNSSAAHDGCCVCRSRFIPGELVFGYMTDLSTSQQEQVKWLHSRCLPEEQLQMTPGEFVAFSPHVTNDERQKLMTILSIRRSGCIKHPKLFCYAPAIHQGWRRWAVPPSGAVRPSPPSQRYTAPLLSLVSQQARAVLLRARQRRQQQTQLAVSRPRHTASGPSVVARRAQVTATSRRPATSSSPVEQQPSRNRTWRRQNALGERAQEFFAAAPVMILSQDWTSDPCIICHENLLKGDEVRRLPCLHSFHRSCIDRWLRLKAVCPLDKLTVPQLLAQHTNGVTQDASSS